MSTRLDVARRKLGRELGGSYGVFTATGGTTSTLVCASAFRSSILPTDAQAYVWVYVPALAEMRRVTLTGLDGSTGTITVDAVFGSAITNGAVFEISGRMPPIHENAANGGAAPLLSLTGALNLALRHLLVDDDDAEITLVSGQRDYSVPSWLDRDERLIDVLRPNAMGTTNYVSTPKRWELRKSARGNVLHFFDPYTFSSGSYVNKLVVKRPGDSLIKVSGTWGDSTSGFVNEADEAGPDENALVEVAKAYCYQALRDSRRGVDRERYDELYKMQVGRARRVFNYDKSNDIDSSVPDDAPVPVAA